MNSAFSISLGYSPLYILVIRSVCVFSIRSKTGLNRRTCKRTSTETAVDRPRIQEIPLVEWRRGARFGFCGGSFRGRGRVRAISLTTSLSGSGR